MILKDYMNKLKGKKLLILAGSVHEIDLVHRAKEMGIYTIVTDYYSPEISPAKMIADEYWDISWTDIEKLKEKCITNHIDGITAGYSESTVESLIKLCDSLSLPCYITYHQLEVTRNKVLFKNECKINGIPVVKEYSDKDDVKNYPVIVKPVDRGGSIGISIANNKIELLNAYNYAMNNSICKKVIIEDFICDGKKFDAYYAISNGNIYLLSTSDTINALNNGNEKVVQSAWTLPSKYHKIFVSKADIAIRNMIKSMGIKYGFIFFSGFFIKDNFLFFETGFRLSGGHMYKFFQELGYPDIQDLFILHALSGNIDELNFNINMPKKEKGIVINYYSKAGHICKINGIEEIKKIKDCKFALQMADIGTNCKDDKAILTKLAMFHFYNQDISSLQKDVKLANMYFTALDENENDLVYDRIDSGMLKNLW